jgi:hypothetical protein
MRWIRDVKLGRIARLSEPQEDLPLVEEPTDEKAQRQAHEGQDDVAGMGAEATIKP